MESHALDVLQQTKIPYSFRACSLMPFLIHLPKLPCSPQQCKGSFCWAGAGGVSAASLSIPDELPWHFPQQNQALIPVLQPNSNPGHSQQFNSPQWLCLGMSWRMHGWMFLSAGTGQPVWFVMGIYGLSWAVICVQSYKTETFLFQLISTVERG